VLSEGGQNGGRWHRSYISKLIINTVIGLTHLRHRGLNNEGLSSAYGACGRP
jgi:hypothetical protein